MLIQLCQIVAVPAEASSTSDALSLRPIKPATPVQGASHQPATSQSQAGQPASRPAAPATPRPSLSQQSHPAAAATRPKIRCRVWVSPPSHRYVSMQQLKMVRLPKKNHYAIHLSRKMSYCNRGIVLSQLLPMRLHYVIRCVHFCRS